MKKMISSKRIREEIKKSSFEMKDIAVILSISQRNLYYKLKNDRLTVAEVNTICRVLNLKFEDIEER